ncbi:MAG: FAD-dependent oxidoreductase [Actinomycetales bacterium]|nr:FAD-dependent oxidoreductase [Actinomycetales bacterium]
MSISPTERRSLWWGVRNDDPDADRPTEPLPAQAETVVVGAGLVGLSTAVELARSGRPPVVIEARRAGAGTSGHSSAKVSLLQGSRLQRLHRHAGVETTAAYVAANRAGQGWLTELLERRGTPFERRLAVTYATSTKGAEQVAEERSVARLVGLAVEDVGGADLPFPVRDAIGLPDQVQVDPLTVIDALLAELTSLGGTVIENVRVTGTSLTRPWTVTTTAGDIRAENVVLATQAPILDRGLEFARMRALRSYVLAFAVDDLASVPRSMSLSLDEPTRSLRTASTASGHFLLVGGNGHEVGHGGSTVDRVREIEDWARSSFPVGPATWSWAAQDYHLTTQVPHIGALPGTGGSLFVATGMDKWGMAMAGAAAQLITGDITGTPPEYAGPLRSSSVSLSDVGETATFVAGVGAQWVGRRAAQLAPGDADEPPAEGEGRIEGNPANPVAVSTVDGRTCRVSASCTHLGGVVQWNDVERSWDCPLHGSRFRADGSLIEGPATTGLRSREES